MAKELTGGFYDFDNLQEVIDHFSEYEPKDVNLGNAFDSQYIEDRFPIFSTGKVY